MVDGLPYGAQSDALSDAQWEDVISSDSDGESTAPSSTAASLCSIAVAERTQLERAERLSDAVRPVQHAPPHACSLRLLRRLTNGAACYGRTSWICIRRFAATSRRCYSTRTRTGSTTARSTPSPLLKRTFPARCAFRTLRTTSPSAGLSACSRTCAYRNSCRVISPLTARLLRIAAERSVQKVPHGRMYGACSEDAARSLFAKALMRGEVCVHVF
jgi:hypothetical protein